MAGFENSSVSQVDLQANVTSESTFQEGFLEIFALSFSFLFGPFINACVLWLIVKEKRIALEFLHLNLCVCEIIISMTSLVYLLEMKFPQLYACSRFSVGLLTTARPLIQCLICVVRYLAVVHPVTFRKYKPLRYKAICCTAAWIICLGSCVFTMFTVVAHEKLYVYFLLFHLFLYFFINLFCCVAVLRSLKQSGPGEKGRKEENHRKAKAFKHILIITLAVFFLFLPILIIGCLVLFSKQDVLNYLSVIFSCLSLACLVPPGLHVYRHVKLPFCSNCSFKI